MSIYEILTLIISFFSIIFSLFAVIVAYLPYSKKIVFKVSLNPFARYDDGFEIDFLIINKTNKDLIIQSLTANKKLYFQIFSEDDYPHEVKPNTHAMFSINSSKLKFDSLPIFNKMVIDRNEKLRKNIKYIEFSIVNSVREAIKYKIRIEDYINACRIYELSKKNKDGTGDLESTIKLRDEFLYYCKKNKSK